MKGLAVESVSGLLALVGSAVGAAAFSLLGALAELAGVRHLLAGQTVVGAWEIWVGTTLLFVGVYLFGYRECWPRVKRLGGPG